MRLKVLQAVLSHIRHALSLLLLYCCFTAVLKASSKASSEARSEASAKLVVKLVSLKLVVSWK
jgi:hypothetical protein